MEKTQDILNQNRSYWNATANEWFGVTALPVWGVRCPTEDELHLMDDVPGQTLLEIGCGSGHSLKYQHDHGAKELWGLDISQGQLDNAKKLLADCGCEATLLCAPMEADAGIPQGYFDCVYSVYAIGWTTDLEGTFRRIAGYLKPGGTFLFSWTHPMHNCIDNVSLRLERSYLDEDWRDFDMGDGRTAKLCNRRLSTYINALAQAGFLIERMVEQTSDEVLNATPAPNDYKALKAQKLPLSFILKCRKAG